MTTSPRTFSFFSIARRTASSRSDSRTTSTEGRPSHGEPSIDSACRKAALQKTTRRSAPITATPSTMLRRIADDWFRSPVRV